jgi:hypothetical protein
MTRVMAIGAMIVLATAALVSAQQPVAPADQAPSRGQAQTPASPPAAGMGDMMPMMETCREMMGRHSMMGSGPMGPGMMGGGRPMDPKTMAQMMEMRGEMMKAVGDIMLKHAKRLEGAASPTK